VPRKTFAVAVADGLPPKPIFQEVVNRNATGNCKQPGNANQPNKPPAPYPRTGREVVITFANKKTLQTGNGIESRALELERCHATVLAKTKTLFRLALFSCC
jgi:hypothetical protein